MQAYAKSASGSPIVDSSQSSTASTVDGLCASNTRLSSLHQHDKDSAADPSVLFHVSPACWCWHLIWGGHPFWYEHVL
jgi:hypothetical protein